MYKVALIGEIHEEGLKILEESGFHYINIKDHSPNNLKKNLRDVNAIALRTAKLTKEILQECKSLKIVSRHGVGYDSVDLNYLNEKKIALSITSNANAVTVAEHVMSMFFGLSKNIKIADSLVRNDKFTDHKALNDTIEMFQKNILIIGFGRIGKALAKRCTSFDTNVYIYDPYVKSKIIREHNCFPITFKKGLKIADFISLHLPLNKKTKYLISKQDFLKMKNNCIIVNTARGGIIKESDLVWALKNKIIHSAGLDVFEKEPPNKNNPLFKLDNLLLSPHNAALTLECRKRMGVETCQNIVSYLTKSKNLIKTNIVNLKNLNLN